MHKFLSTADHVLAASVDGKVDTDDIRALYARLDEKLKKHGSVAIMLDITGFSDATRDAIDADIRHELSLLGDLDQFRRMALVTDKEWVAYMAEWVSSIIPTLDIRMFASGKEKAALKWAAEC